MPEATSDATRATLLDRGTVALLVAVAYVPLLLTQPGQVGADTKTYLYLDPARLLRDATSMWDPGIGTGTVTHQNIGYLWPMGPWYRLGDLLGLPDWVTQRLWLGTLLLLAGLGVRWLLRTIGWSGAGVLIAALAYQLHPYLLDYSARISVILLPWAGLPWLIGLTALSLRTRGWRHPALFALVALTIGGINATALLMIAFGPALWLVHAWLVEREATGREVLAAVGRIGALTVLTSLWWMAGLWAQGRHGLPVIRFTESYRTVAESSTGPEVLRGLGYWFFYGRDKLGPWIEPSVDFTNRVPLLALSYLLPVAAIAIGSLTRWRHRSYFLALIVFGGLVAIGSHPWDGPSPLGAAFKDFTRTEWGLSLRSTPRAVPQVALGTSVLLGAGIAGLARRAPRAALPATAVVALLIAANLPTLWTGEMVAANLRRPEALPSYWEDATAALDAAGDETRILELPGTDFASYRWGNTVDPITPGLLDRPYVARELFAYGSPTSMGLLMALDRRLQEDVLDPAALAPVARLLGVGDVVVRSDLQYERFRSPRPRPTWELLRTVPGLGRPQGFGAPTPNVAGPEQPMIDEIELAMDPDLPHPPPVAAFPVEDPTPIVRTRTSDGPLVLAGGPEGVVSAAAAGLLAQDRPLLYAAALEADASLERVLDEDAWLVVTDTNRRRGQRWGTIRETTGRTERSGETPYEYDPTDNRLDLFPGTDDDERTVSVQLGPATIWGSDYGNAVTYTPDDRPENALDADPLTAWRVGAIDEPAGEFLQIDLDDPVTTDHIVLLQPIFGIANRSVRDVRLTFDDGTAIDATLGDASFTEPGQRVEFPERAVHSVRVEIRSTDVGPLYRYDGMSGVGFAEVKIGDVAIEELIRPPTALLDAVGAPSADHRLSLLFTRARSNPAEPVRTDEEVAIRRLVTLPTDRTFTVRGAARLSSYAPDDLLDRLLGLPGAAGGGVDATSSLRLPGALAARASATIDGDPATFWSPPFQTTRTDHLEFELAGSTTIDEVELGIVTDGRHSTPRVVRIEVDGQPVSRREILPDELLQVPEPNAASTVTISFPPTTGSRITVVFEEVTKRRTTDWYSGGKVELPIAITEVGVEGLHVDAPTGPFDSGCRDDLLSIDARPVSLRVTGSAEDAVARRSLDVALCGDDASGVSVPAGATVVRTGIGRDLGIDLDWLLLDDASPVGDEAITEPPAVGVEWTDATAGTARVRDAIAPYWLVLGQSHSDGWRATIDGEDLGDPIVIDGFANGWRIDPADVGADVDVSLRWAPQGVVDLALLLSAAAVALCLVVAWRGRPAGARGASTAPELVWPPPAAAPVPARTAAVLTAAIAVWAILDTPWGSPTWVLVPVIAWLSMRVRSAASLPSALAAACLAGAGAYITIQQVRWRYLSDFQWPLEFDEVHVLGVLCLLLLGVQAVRDALAERSAPAAVAAAATNTIGAPEEVR